VRPRAFEFEALIDQMGNLTLCLQPAVNAVTLIEVLPLVVLDDPVLPQADPAGILAVQCRHGVGFRGLWRQHID